MRTCVRDMRREGKDGAAGGLRVTGVLRREGDRPAHARTGTHTERDTETVRQAQTEWQTEGREG